MEQIYQITRQQFKEIEELVESATLSSTKESAKNYIAELKTKRRWLTPPANFIFDELVSEVKVASGQVKDKEHWTQAALMSLYKLGSFVEKEQEEQE